MLNDPLIRAGVHSKLLKRHHANPHTLVVEELGLEHGKSRVDVAVINGLIHGYEIKSDADDLSRLPHQIEIFSRVLDKLTIVTGDRLVSRCELALPPWCGIVRCNVGPRGGTNFQTIRPARQNVGVEQLSVLMLLWRNEAIDALRNRGYPPSLLRRSREVLYSELAEQLSCHEVRRLVTQTIKARTFWRDHQQP